MAKRSNPDAAANRESRGQLPPRVTWQETDGGFTPTVHIASIVMRLDSRPMKQFLKGERDAILVWVKQAVSEPLFGAPYLLVNDQTLKSARNPDWDLLPYLEESPTDPSTLVLVTPTPSMSQEAAGNKLVVTTG